jgi:eukaryotic-like serine/threonine-protein kinase
MSAAATIFPPRYADADKIAAGGMGEIYVARDTALGRKVAIKLLSERFARDEAVRRRFTREALAAARLSGHPHIVTIFDVGEADGRPFIVMEFLPGGTLAQRVRRGPASRDEAIEWLKQAADALDEAHRRGVVHRDVKPANMLLDERGAVHMGDFGIARVVDEVTTGMTLAGTVLGTAGYLSPEQARGEPAAPASDVYSLGIVAYELLTGGRPFQGGSATAEAAAHIHQPVPPASERDPGLPEEVDAVFERVLSKDSERRYTSARDFVRALCLALEDPTKTQLAPAAAPTAGVTAATRREPVAVAAARTQRRSRPWLPVAAALALAAAAIAGVVVAATLAGGGDDPPPRTTATGDGARAAAPQKVTVTETIGETKRVVETATVTAPPPPPPPPSPSPSPGPPPPAAPAGNAGSGGGDLSMGEARQLTDEATYAMRAGDYERAYALAERALGRLRGTGDIYEAYAYYDAGRSLAELGECSKALEYLNRSEQIQGSRAEITQARATCA